MAILYKGNETDFNHLGLGPLDDAVSILVTEERNGMFELEMKYPIEGTRINEVKLDRLIKADAGHNLKGQRFKIIRITKPIDGIVTVNAEHVSYLTQDLSLKPTVNYSGNASQALNTWNNNLVDDSPFIVASDITTTGSGSWSIKKVKNAREALGGVSSSILETYGGEYRFDNYSIRLMAQRGVNSGALIAYGRNLVDLTQEESIADTFTSVYPYAVYQDANSKEVLLTLPEYFVDSEYVGNYARRKILPVDFSEDEIKDVATLRSRTNSYIKSNNIGIPKVNMQIKYIDLAKTLDYKDLAILEEVNLCDNVFIYFEQLDVNTSAKIIKTVWDDLLEQYDSIEVGEAKSSLSNSINATVDGKLETIVQRVNTIQLTADGLDVIYRGPEQPPPGNIGDLWYEPDGIYENMYQWDGSIWKLMLSTRDLDSVSEEVKKHTDEIATVTQSANDAVAKADQLIIDAGFIRLDTAQIKSDALTTINTAQSAYNNAISAMSKADIAISTTESFSLLVNDLEQSVTFKADSSRVDTISGKVDSQGLLIQANADALIYKADKTSVDTINKTVNQHTNDISINAQAINARLTSTQVDSLVAAKNYVNQTQLNTTSSGLQLDITKVRTDLSNLDGTNWYRPTINPPSKSGGGTFEIQDSLPYGFYMVGDQGTTQNVRLPNTITGNGYWTVSFDLMGTQNGGGSLYVDICDISKTQFRPTSDNKYSRFHLTVNVTNYTEDVYNFVDFLPGWSFNYVKNIKVEKGKIATPFTLPTEDIATLEQFTTLDATVNGIQTTVGTKASQSQVTQIATQVSTKVESATYNSKMTQLDSSINLRVAKADLISQINIQSNNILIQSGKLYLDAASVVFSGSAFIPSAAITSLTVDKLNGGTANFANFNAININVSSLVGNTTDFIQSNWNGINNTVTITAAGMRGYSSTWGESLYQGGRLDFTLSDYGVGLDPYKIQFTNSGWGKTNIRGQSEGLLVRPELTNTGTGLNSSIHLSGNISYLQFNNLQNNGVRGRIELSGDSTRFMSENIVRFTSYAQPGIYQRTQALAYYTYDAANSYNNMAIIGNRIQFVNDASNSNIYITPAVNGKLVVGKSGSAVWYNVECLTVTQKSTRKIKDNIIPLTNIGLQTVNALTVVEYDLKQNLAKGIYEKQIGFIFEDSLSIANKEGESIDLGRVGAINTKAIQELSFISNNHETKISILENKVVELERKIQKLESAA